MFKPNWKAAVMILFSILFATGCKEKSLLVKSSRGGHIDCLTVNSPAIADNTIGDSGERIIYVFLPPGYDETKEHYPVIYYLHGQGGDSSELLRFEESLYSAMEKKMVLPFILVGVNGDNPLGGTFYVNSPATGRWEDHLANELIPLIDKRYRTLSAPESRGLMGFSMGGFGVLHNGLMHSDTFGAVWALCPGVLEPEVGLPEALDSWRQGGGTFLKCYTAAFSPSGTIPELDGSTADNIIREEWENGFGNWNPRLAAWLNSRGAGTSALSAVRIVAGSLDFYTWIPKGSTWLAHEMETKGLPVEFKMDKIGHTIGRGTVNNDAMEFFGRILVRE